MAYLFGNIVNYSFGLLGVIIIAGIMVQLIYRYFSKEKQEIATVIKKQSYDKQVYRKNEASFVKKEYVVTFQCGNKQRHFEVSELSYCNYKVNQKGMLKFKGSRLIDFKERS